MTRDDERRLLLVLLFVQAGIGGLTAFGAGVAVAAGFRADLLLVAGQLAFTAATVGLGIHSYRGSRRAALTLAVLQALLALQALAGTAIGLGEDRQLAPLATNLVLPGAIAWMAGRIASAPSRPAVPEGEISSGR